MFRSIGNDREKRRPVWQDRPQRTRFEGGASRVRTLECLALNHPYMRPPESGCPGIAESDPILRQLPEILLPAGGFPRRTSLISGNSSLIAATIKI
jgi:hypothetical protein